MKVVLLVLGLLLSSCATTTPPYLDSLIVGKTGSMLPTFKGGELRIVRHIPYSDLHSGLIVLTYFDGGWHPHRLVIRTQNRWMTRGDHAHSPDPHLMDERTYGGVIDP